jgi:hypothetical protein
MNQLAVVLCVACMTGVAQAQPVYRCGPDGTEYSHTPCPGGKVLESTDPRSAAQREEAVRVAAQERRKAAQMERERRAEQAAIKPARAAGFNGRPPPAGAAASASERGKSKKRVSKSKPDKNADFVAVEPGAKKKRVRQ